MTEIENFHGRKVLRGLPMNRRVLISLLRSQVAAKQTGATRTKTGKARAGQRGPGATHQSPSFCWGNSPACSMRQLPWGNRGNSAPSGATSR
jgi:hypothetical protein